MMSSVWIGTALPSGGSPSVSVLFGVAALVLAAKAFGLIARRFGQPPVLGELVVGILLGNLLPLLHGRGGLEFVTNDPTLRVLGEIGVLILLFDVGLEADLRAMARVGRAAFLVAVIGVAAPFALGWAASSWLLPDLPALAHVFVGASLTATSVGITARVLKDLGAGSSREGQIILGAAVLDDVFGLVILAVVGGMVTSAGASLGDSLALAPIIVLKATAFLGGAGAMGIFASERITRAIGSLREPGLLLAIGLAMCFSFAWFAEAIGLAGILGAFAAGVLLDPYGRGVRVPQEHHSLAEMLHPLSTIFVPLFFVLTGIQVDLSVLASGEAVMLGGVLVLAAVVGKWVAGLGAMGACPQPRVVAVGMIPRGEVGLIFAGIGAKLSIDGRPLLPPVVFSALVMMVLVTTLVTPVWLARLLGRAAPAPE